MWWINKNTAYNHKYRTRMVSNERINNSVQLDKRMVYCIDGCKMIWDGHEYYSTEEIPTIGKTRGVCPKCKSEGCDE
jgi:hypothetical protein